MGFNLVLFVLGNTLAVSAEASPWDVGGRVLTGKGLFHPLKPCRITNP